MKKLWNILLALLPLLSSAQTPNELTVDSTRQGIHFEQGLRWKALLEKAKAEGKYIFVDCYTTWCGPCRQMEKYIYPLEEVGTFLNSYFLSIKVQMDSTKDDNEYTQSWYADAIKIAKDYNVQAYPTYLFFSPAGMVVHRGAGGISAKGFMALAKDAMNPARQYYTLLANYHPENMNLQEMRRKADSLRYIGPELAEKIAVDYLNKVSPNDLYNRDNLLFLREFTGIPLVQEIAKKFIDQLKIYDLKNKANQDFVTDFRFLPGAKKLADQYIARLTENELRDRNNIQFIIPFIQSSSDIGFSVFYSNSKTIDQVIPVAGYAEGFICHTITQEIIDPAVTLSRHSNKIVPDWEKLFKKIQLKYNTQYAGRCISLAKYEWYMSKKDDKQSFKNLVLYYDKYGADISDAFDLNNSAWNIFLRSTDTAELKKALSWSDRAVKLDPTANWMDTYANILYKLKQRELALRWERVAAKLDPDDRNIQLALEKMKKGAPTWNSQ